MKKTPIVPGMILLSKYQSFMLLASYVDDADDTTVVWMNVQTSKIITYSIGKKTELYLEDYDHEFCGFI